MSPQGCPKKRIPSALKKASSGERSIHPALVPGISVDDTDAQLPTTKVVFAVALFFSAAAFI